MHMLRLRLLVDYRTEPIMEKRFRILAHISNQLRKHVKKQLSRLEKDRVYQELKKEYGRLKKLDPDNHKVVAETYRASPVLWMRPSKSWA